MQVGLVGYFGFGNYGDELFVEIFRTAIPEATFTVLKGCDGVSAHDPVEIARQDCIVIGGGDLVISSGFSRRYWDPTLLSRPVFIVGVGVDSERGHSDAAVRRMRRFYQHDSVKLIAARDTASEHWIRRHLRPPVPVEVYPDLVASLPMRRRDDAPPVFGLVLRAQATQAAENAQRLVDRAAELGYRTANVVLGTGTTLAEDLPAARAVRTDELVVCHSSTEMTEALGGCALVASQRLHGCIAAMMMGIPTIGLRTVGKFDAWFGQFEPRPPIYRLDDPDLVATLDYPIESVDPATVATLQERARFALDRLAASIALVPLHHRSPGYYYAHFDTSVDQRARMLQLSPRLRANPSAVLEPGRELAWYRDEIARWKGPEYLESLDKLVAEQPVLNELPPTTRAIVTIPVAAAAENETIYSTLSLYAQQREDWLRVTPILLYVNYADATSRDPEETSAIATTIDEIQRARVDFPQLRMAVVVEPFDPALPRRHNGIIGYVGRRMYDLALMAALRAMTTGQLSPDRDILLIRNDADAAGMSATYLQRMITVAADRPTADAFVGGIYWGTANYDDYPGFGVAMAFKEGIRALTMRRGGYRRLPATNGSNVAIRMSTLAAVGGVGHSPYYGAGGDDVEISSRINQARHQTADVARPIRYVSGCAIDATGERPLGVYRTGKSVVHTWSTFNRGDRGYLRRGDAGGDEADDYGPEDPTTSIRRIEQAITDLVNHWYHDPDLTESALRLMIGSHDDAGAPTYQARWDENRFSFEFTDAGHSWLAGRLDRYGERLRNSLYGPRGSSSRMVQSLERPA